MSLYPKLVRLSLSVLVAAFSASGCERKSNPAVANTAAPRSAPRPAGPDAGVRLFGAPGTEQGVVFNRTAASSVEQHTFPTDGEDFDPDLDPDGQRLVFASTRHAPVSQIYIKAVDGATVTQVTDGDANDVQPAFDPAGRRIAFSSDRSGNWDIWVVNVDGRNLTQITTNPMPDLHPNWSPDGEHLVYCRMTPRDERGELWVADLSNPGVRRLIGEGMFPAWSPKGERIAYQRARARGSRWYSIWTLEYVNGETRFPTEVISRADAALISPDWSPDGRQITFAAVTPQGPRSVGEAGLVVEGRRGSRVGIVDADGRGFQVLTESWGTYHSPSWSTDGRIYFTAKLDKTETIWSIRPFRPPLPDHPGRTVDDTTKVSAAGNG